MLESLGDGEQDAEHRCFGELSQRYGADRCDGHQGADTDAAVSQIAQRRGHERGCPSDDGQDGEDVCGNLRATPADTPGHGKQYGGEGRELQFADTPDAFGLFGFWPAARVSHRHC